MTLTVRLDPTLDGALERHCAATGSSKSLVVQESLAAYLLKAEYPAQAVKTPDDQPVSANLLAFVRAGLHGCVTQPEIGIGTGTADKAAVRLRIKEKLQR